MDEVVQTAAHAAEGEIAAPEGSPDGIAGWASALFAEATAHERAGRLQEAERLVSRILARLPDQAETLHLGGVVLFRRGARADGLMLMRRAMQAGLDTPLAWRNLCEALRLQGHLEEALGAGQRAVGRAPDDAAAWHNLALVHTERHEFDVAEACERRAVQIAPDHAGAHFGLSELLLSQGRFEEGWEQYRWRFLMAGAGSNLPPGDKPVWDGRVLPPGRLLIVADQGYGDAIQFCRYLPWVMQRCDAPLISCDRVLRPVLSQFAGARLVHRWQDLPDYDCYIPMTGLARLAGTRLHTIPAPKAYLRARPDDVGRWAGRLDQLLPGGGRRIGLVWAGRSTHANDRLRSATLSSLAPLFARPGDRFVSLQKGERQAEIGGYFGRAALVNLGPELSGWDDTMAVLELLDAVVTVDTAVAHLAAAMGRTVHLMLPHASEWRWLLQRTDSPWYPSMRLHRQEHPGDWDAVARSALSLLDR